MNSERRDLINRRIHELRGLSDEHEWIWESGDCPHCHWRRTPETEKHKCPARQIPDYFASSTPRGELDDAVAKCVEKVGGPTYYSKLEIEVRASIGERPRNYDIAAASPEAICMAIAACIEEQDHE
jgi:hypothetical protein